MATWVGVEIDGLCVEEYQNYHSTWFFKRSDRVQEEPVWNDNGQLIGFAFEGYRATVATIRRRMTLSGYDLKACENHFNENLRNVIEMAQVMIDINSFNALQFCHDDSEQTISSHRINVYRQFIDTVKNISLSDWIKALPEAIERNKTIIVDHSDEPRWYTASDTPLVNALLCNVPLYPEFSCFSLFNFPCTDSVFFQVAYLSCCEDDALCELNIAPVIASGYEQAFRDLREIRLRETEPHLRCRQSIEEIQSLSRQDVYNISLQRMCYASIITAMEAYLGDILRREIFSRPVVKERFVAGYAPFKTEKFPLSSLYSTLRDIDTIIKGQLDRLSLHKIDTAMSIFSSSLITEFPADQLPFIGAAVEKRHHIVHRNGKDKDDNFLSFDRDTVSELARGVLHFTRAIDAQIRDGFLLEDECEDDNQNL